MLALLGLVRAVALLRRGTGATWRDALGAFMIWQSTSIVVARASVQGLFAKEAEFLRTPKTAEDARWWDAVRGNLAGVPVRCPGIAGIDRLARHRRIGGYVTAALLVWPTAAFVAAPLNSLGAQRAACPASSTSAGVRSTAGSAPAPPRSPSAGLPASAGAVALAAVLLAPAGQQVVSPNPVGARPRPPSVAGGAQHRSVAAATPRRPRARRAHEPDVGAHLGAHHVAPSTSAPADEQRTDQQRRRPARRRPRPRRRPRRRRSACALRSAASPATRWRAHGSTATRPTRPTRRGGTGSPSPSPSAGTPGGRGRARACGAAGRGRGAGSWSRCRSPGPQTSCSRCCLVISRPGLRTRISRIRHSVGVSFWSSPSPDAGRDPVGGEVDHPVPQPDARAAARRDPAGHRPHPGEQLLDPERLGDVVVGAGVEGGDLLDLLGAPGEHDDRRGRPAAQPGDHLGALHVGEAEVEDRPGRAGAGRPPGAPRHRRRPCARRTPGRAC